MKKKKNNHLFKNINNYTIEYRHDVKKKVYKILIPYRKGTKWGYADNLGEVVIPCIYDETYLFGEQKFALVKVNQLYGVVDKSGEIVIESKYNNISLIEDKYCILQINNKYLISSISFYNSIELKPFEFDYIEYLSNGNFSVFKGKIINLDLGFSQPDVEYKGYWGIHSDNKQILECNYDRINVISDSLYSVKKDSKWGIIIIPINMNNQEIRLIYDEIISLKNGFFAVLITHLWFIKNGNGFDISDLGFEEIGDYSEGLINVRYNGKWGYLDKTGKNVIPFRYDFADIFSCRRALIGINENGEILFGNINHNGDLSIKIQFSFASNFASGKAKVRMGEKELVVGIDGEVLLNPEIGVITEFEKNVVVVNVEGGGYWEDEAGINLNFYKIYNNNGDLILGTNYFSGFSNGVAVIGHTDFENQYLLNSDCELIKIGNENRIEGFDQFGYSIIGEVSKTRNRFGDYYFESGQLVILNSGIFICELGYLFCGKEYWED